MDMICPWVHFTLYYIILGVACSIYHNIIGGGDQHLLCRYGNSDMSTTQVWNYVSNYWNGKLAKVHDRTCKFSHCASAP